jgi:hypothetical protein
MQWQFFNATKVAQLRRMQNHHHLIKQARHPKKEPTGCVVVIDVFPFHGICDEDHICCPVYFFGDVRLMSLSSLLFFFQNASMLAKKTFRRDRSDAKGFCLTTMDNGHDNSFFWNATTLP